jgi:hypothetical protein
MKADRTTRVARQPCLVRSVPLSIVVLALAGVPASAS